jgi:hypothetical protein
MGHLISISTWLVPDRHFVQVPVPRKDRKKYCINFEAGEIFSCKMKEEKNLFFSILREFFNKKMGDIQSSEVKNSLDKSLDC